jgi:hypothetical protein
VTLLVIANHIRGAQNVALAHPLRHPFH